MGSSSIFTIGSMTAATAGIGLAEKEIKRSLHKKRNATVRVPLSAQKLGPITKDMEPSQILRLMYVNKRRTTQTTQMEAVCAALKIARKMVLAA